MATPTVHVRDNITVDTNEDKIFRRLLATLDYYGHKTQLRVAGGWVRDKLLGRECKDIDIVLENMTGSTFAENVRDYLSTLKEEAKFTIIASNPDKSKHLETAKMHIFNVEVDFVNLRCEEYSDNSRIPTTQKFGTPEQDALRRDLTINSLFYNINTKSIEDWTNRGLEDLKCGKIVTPLPPKDTFMEDPLRVLRAIRFGSRFGFILDEQLKEAAACEEVKAALSAKISRERIGNEINLMISGDRPVQAMTYICELKLFWDVFSLHPQCEPASVGCDSNCVTYLDCTWNLIQSMGPSSFTDEQRRFSFYASMFLPLRNTMYKDGKRKNVPVVDYIMRDSLKCKVRDATTVVNIHNAVEKFLCLLPHLVINSEDVIKPAEKIELGIEFVDVPITSEESKLRVLTGFLLRESKIEDLWRVALLTATLLYPTNILNKKNFNPEDRRALYVKAEKAVTNLGLDKVWLENPLLDGDMIIRDLQLKPGKIVGILQRKVVAWQLAHPSGVADECSKWLKETVHSPNRRSPDMEELDGPYNKKQRVIKKMNKKQKSEQVTTCEAQIF